MFPFHEFFSHVPYEHHSLWIQEARVWSAFQVLIPFLNARVHKIEIDIPETIFLKKGGLISIGLGTKIDPGVLIEGPCSIGKNCHIRQGAMLRGGVILGDGCVVGHASEIKHSILFAGACAAHLCYVGDSILGKNVNLGAGVKCANLRLDRKAVRIQTGGEMIETGLRKLGAILGDGVQIGCNSVLNPGTLIGPQSVVYPLVNLGGYIPARRQVRNTQTLSIQPIPEKILEHLLK